MRTIGKLAFHVHHDMLFESLTEEYEVRLRYIREEKPENERSLRERLFKVIPGKELPTDLKKLCAKGERLWTKGQKLYAEGRKLYDEGNKLYAEGKKLCDEGRKLWAEGQKLWTKGKKLYDEGQKLWDEGKKLYAKEMQDLHIKLCPDCPWNGKTIFTRMNAKGFWY